MIEDSVPQNKRKLKLLRAKARQEATQSSRRKFDVFLTSSFDRDE
jgi:hypothetical protein